MDGGRSSQQLEVQSVYESDLLREKSMKALNDEDLSKGLRGPYLSRRKRRGGPRQSSYKL
jgi:hypothetical protein